MSEIAVQESPRQRPRVTSRNSVRTRARILAGATQLFEEVGSEAFSVRALARRLEIAVPTIHHHFENRHGLLDAVVDEFYKEVEAGAKDTLAEIINASSLDEAVEKAARSGFRLARANRRFVEWLTLDTVRNGQLAPHRQAETQAPFLNGLAMVLAKPLGTTETDIRLRLRTLILTVARYAVIDESELESITGQEGSVQSVEDHVAWLARTFLTP